MGVIILVKIERINVYLFQRYLLDKIMIKMYFKLEEKKLLIRILFMKIKLAQILFKM